MDYFGDYTIESASCHPSQLLRRQDNTIVPTSDPFGSLGPCSPCDTRPVDDKSALINMSVLTRDLSLHTLDGLAALEGGPSRSRTPPSRTASPTNFRAAPCWKRRMQRQRDLRLQTDPAHLRNVSDMVRDIMLERSSAAAGHEQSSVQNASGVSAMASVLSALSIQTPEFGSSIDDVLELSPASSSTGSSPSSSVSSSARPSVYVFSGRAHRGSIDMSPISPKFGGISKVRHRRTAGRL